MTFAHSWQGIAFGFAFTVLLAVAAGCDVRYRRIPNALVLTTFVSGAVFTVAMIGPRALAFRFLGGAATGLIVWLPFWALGLMGAGDVKIFAAAAAWLGPATALGATLLSAVVGGVLGIAWLVVARFSRVAVSAAPARQPDGKGHAAGDRPPANASTPVRVTVPYGVAMAVGLTVAAWIPRLVH